MPDAAVLLVEATALAGATVAEVETIVEAYRHALRLEATGVPFAAARQRLERLDRDADRFRRAADLPAVLVAASAACRTGVQHQARPRRPSRLPRGSVRHGLGRGEMPDADKE